jgi:hypothetical protein
MPITRQRWDGPASGKMRSPKARKGRFAEAALFLLLTAGAVSAQTSNVATVEGMVTTSGQTPVSQARVVLTAEGTGSLSSGFSDDEGRFIIRGIPPGRYRVSVSRTGLLQSRERLDDLLGLEPKEHLKGLRLELFAPGVISGRVLDEQRKPMAGMRVFAARPRYENGRRVLSVCEFPEGQSVQTDKRGDYRLNGLEPGPYYLLMQPYNVCDVVPQFYPATTDPGQAVPVEVIAGATLPVDLHWQSYPSYSVSFKVADPPGTTRPLGGFPSGGVVSLLGSNDLEVRALKLWGLSSNFRRGPELDQYTISGLPRGKYDIYYATDFLFSNFAHFEVDIADRDVDAGTLFPGALGTLLGKVDLSDIPAGAARNIRVRLLVADGPQTFVRPFTGYVASLSTDGSFNFKYLPSHRYFVQIERLPPDAFLSSARYMARDVLTEGISVSDRPLGSLELAVKANGGTVEGIVHDSLRVPFERGDVALIPSGFRRRNTTLYRSSPIKPDGRFSIRGVLPGEYLALAWKNVEPGAWKNERFLQSFESRAVKVTVREGSNSTINIPGITGR